MRALAVLPMLGLVVLWAWALWVYPSLPESIPMHFDGSGAPDRFAPRSPFNWFLVPGVATLMAGLVAYLLPAWIRRLAFRNAAHLNVPRKKEYARLPPAARVRALEPMVALLRVVSIQMLALFGLILYGSSKVASKEWSGLPSALLWIVVGFLVVTPLGFIPLGKAAVARELRRAEK